MLHTPTSTLLRLCGIAAFLFVCLTIMVLMAYTSSNKELHANKIETITQQKEELIKHPRNEQRTSDLNNNASRKPLTIQMQKGYFRCNRYPKIGILSTNLKSVQDYHYTPPKTLMASCKFNNLCLTNKGRFVLFHDYDRIVEPNVESVYNQNPWIYIQGTIQFDRGNFGIQVEDGDMQVTRNNEGKVISIEIVKKKKSCGSIENHNRTSCVDRKPFKISEHFKFHEEPFFIAKRFAAGNVGHNLSELMTMIVSLMMNFLQPQLPNGRPQRELHDNRILFIDDVMDVSGENWVGAFRYDTTVSSKFSIQVAKLISNRDPLQLCSKNNTFLLQPAPCTFDPIKETPKEEVLETCFSSLYGGHTVSNVVLDMYGKEKVLVTAREIVFKNLNIQPFPSLDADTNPSVKNYLMKKDIVVAIHKKSLSGRHGRIILNVDELITYFKEHLPKYFENGDIDIMGEAPQLLHSEHPLYTPSKDASKKRSIRIEALDLYKFESIEEQVRYFSEVDVFISDHGSAAYYSFFFRDDTTLFIPPSCTAEKTCVNPYGYNLLMALPNVQVVSVLELTGGQFIQNIKRPVSAEPDNRDVVLPTDVMVKGVVAALKKRYHKILNDPQ